jgi:hypothetical protein
VLLDAPNPAAIVPGLPVQELYFAIREVGLSDALDLVALATSAQLRGCVDLEAWRRDELDEGRMEEWLQATLEVGGPVKLGRLVETLDPELASLFVRRATHVYDVSLEDEIPDEPEGAFWPTPDGAFVVDILPEGERGKSVQRLLDALYRYDLVFARWLLMSARSELASQLEEESFRFRSARMADLGFVDYYEALGTYAPLEASMLRRRPRAAEQSVREDQPPLLPVPLRRDLPSDSLLLRALAELTSSPLAGQVEAELLLLVNRTLAADLAEPGDLDAAREALEQAVGCVDVALEHLVLRGLQAGGPALTTEALVAAVLPLLSSYPIEQLFRVGYGVIARLQTLAQTLLREGVLCVPGQEAPLADAPAGRMLEGLLLRRPRAARAVVAPLDREGTKDRGLRPFHALAEVRITASALEELARLGPVVLAALSLDSPAALPLHVLRHHRSRRGLPGQAVTYGTLVRTAAARLLLELGTRPFAGLTRRERRLVDEQLPTLESARREALAATLTERVRAQGLVPPPLWHRLVSEWLSHWGREEPVGSAPLLCRTGWLN